MTKARESWLLGCGQITWRDTPEEDVLAQIARAGYAGAPGPLQLGQPASAVIEQFAAHRLKPAPPYYAAAFWNPDDEAEILGAAEPTARYVRELDCTELYVAANGGPGVVAPTGRSRADVAGHVSPDDAMTDEQFAQFGRVLDEFGRRASSEGIHTCFHNHVGTFIETEQELDRLMTLVDERNVALGLDTGHLAWAGADAAAVCERYASRIRTLHLKDVDERVRQRGAAEAWDYQTFTRNGIFTEVGDGSVDFPAILATLERSGFQGWLIVETDVTQRPTALESAEVSRAYLRTLGL